MLMSKNVNNDVSKDSPIVITLVHRCIDPFSFFSFSFHFFSKSPPAPIELLYVQVFSARLYASRESCYLISE